VPAGYSLLGALAYHGLPGMAPAEKEGMRGLAMRGPPFSDSEQQALLTYCTEDVRATVALLHAMLPKIDLPRALLRGRSCAAVARMEHLGVPIDTDTLGRLRANWGKIKTRLVWEIDRDYGVFVPTRNVHPAVATVAAEHGVDPQQLAAALDRLWHDDQQAAAEVHAARRAARRLTGLTPRRMAKWEDAGHDFSTWPGLDEAAGDLADTHPALGLGPGYGEGVDDDKAGPLWERLRDKTEKRGRKYCSDTLRRAAELVIATSADPTAPGGPMRFSAERWGEYLARHNIPWPRLPSGALALDDETFRETARAFPTEVGPIRELRHILSQMRLSDLAVGHDGRNRVLLSPFGSKTGRNCPSNSRFIFGTSTWLRSLIKPERGQALAYIDWSGQELGIAAYLSGDKAMQEAYTSGDPYLWFAKRAGAVPQSASKQSHATIRDQFKTVMLGTLFGLSAHGIARKLSVPLARGEELLQLHQKIFPRFRQWTEQTEMQAMLRGELSTCFGWKLHVGPHTKSTTLKNFLIQAGGAEMLRLAACLASERGVRVCCPIHDALLVEGPLGDIEDVVRETQRAMKEASELVLPRFPLRADVRVIRWPDRYSDPRGEKMWATIQRLLDELDPEQTDQGGDPLPE
jgi:hypothetical protein